MTRTFVWILGGVSAIAAAAVAGWIAVSMRNAPSGEPVGAGATLVPPAADEGAPAAPQQTAGGEPAPPAAVPQADGVAADSADAAPQQQPDPAPDPAPALDAAAQQVIGDEAEADAATAQDEGVAGGLPSFDVVRVARDGSALVAGLALPGATVTVRVDGAEVAGAEADAAGQFVAMFDLDPSDAVQVMTLEMAGDGGRVMLSGDTVILMPRPAAPGDVAAVGSVPVDGSPAEPDTVVVLSGPDAPTPAESVDPVTGPAAGEAGPAQPEPLSDVGAVVAEPVDTAPATGAAVAVATPDAPPGATADVPADVPAVPGPDPVTQLADAQDMPTAFVVRGSGAVEIIDRAPRVMDTVVIDAISYSAQGDVQISGRAARAVPDARLRIYLDNRPIAVARAEQGDWMLDLPQVDPGVYTLRVDQLDAEGGVSSRFETPFQREEPARVAAAQARIESATRGAEVAGDGATPAAATPGPAGDAPVTAPAAVAATQPDTPAAAPEGTVRVPPVSLITVQPGHTLWAISRDRYGAGELYVVIYRANRSQIRNPDLIYPGQIFELPDH